MRRLPARRAILSFAALALLGTSCAQLRDLPELKDADLKGIKLAQSSKIYDASGSLLTTLHGEEDRTIIPLKKMPESLINGVISIEDERFYDHDGVDVKAIMRAVVANITSGDIEEGGSTITQQYVKNTLIAPGETAAKTIERKIDEAALARQLEERMEKDEILSGYLNTVYFGKGAYGVQAAAKTFFDKPARKLELHESALLAAVIQAPENYDPFDKRTKEAALNRRNLVLTKMEQLGHISATEAAEAKSQKLKVVRGDGSTTRYPAPYFIDYVRRLIKYDPRFKKIAGTPEDREQQMYQGGLRIYTTIDLDMQAAAEQAVQEQLGLDSDPHASLVAIDPENGEVRAMVGGRDYFAPRKKDRFAKLNLATVLEPNLDCERNSKGNCKRPFAPAPGPGAGRQAGSAFKSFALAAALEEGIPLSKVFEAEGDKIIIKGADNGADYPVQNYEGTSYGKMTLFEATVRSVNTVYALLGQEVGPQDVVDTAAAMGIRTPLSAVASAPLGTNSVNPLGMASGYATLASNGTYHQPVAITRITDASGKTVYEDPTVAEQAISPVSAYLTTTALQQVIERGTGTNANIGRPAAGKTGTAQEYRDAWFGGYTPDLAAAVWVGYPEGQIEMKPSCSGSTSACRPTRTITSQGVTGGSFPALIWQSFMSRALAETPATPFTVPDIELVTVTIDTRTGCLAGKFTPSEFRTTIQTTKDAKPEEECRVKGDNAKVPDVFGFPLPDAVRILEGDGFDVSIVEESSSTYPPGIVIGQTPEGGAKAPRGSTVTLTVSVKSGGNSGGGGGGGGGGGDDDDSRRVPNVLGMPESQARQTLENEGFRVEVIYEAESSPGAARRNKRKVWKQSPASGNYAPKGDTVFIWVNP
jgi:penicillin-binding protein 1A